MFVSYDWSTICSSVEEIKEEFNIKYVDDGWYWHKKTNDYMFIESLVVGNDLVYRVYTWNSYDPRNDLRKIIDLPIYEVANV